MYRYNVHVDVYAYIIIYTSIYIYIRLCICIHATALLAVSRDSSYSYSCGTSHLSQTLVDRSLGSLGFGVCSGTALALRRGMEVVFLGTAPPCYRCSSVQITSVQNHTSKRVPKSTPNKIKGSPHTHIGLTVC